MHILVGGGTGFIGKHLTNYLRHRGHQVTIVSRFAGKDRITWQQLRWDDAPKDVDGE
jgi:nucleoside-diphosphate-sugar epimerase